MRIAKNYVSAKSRLVRFPPFCVMEVGLSSSYGCFPAIIDRLLLVSLLVITDDVTAEIESQRSCTATEWDDENTVRRRRM